MLVLLSTLCLGGGPSFNDDVLPILSNNCFTCHGPDEAARQANLRLDTRAGAITGGAIVPGEPDASELLRRVSAAGKQQMPPAHTGKQLSEHQIDILHRWIEVGAPWETHWSFTKPESVAPPEGDAWCRTPVDAFIKRRLDAEGLTPNGDAHRRTLIRRLSLDLTGLPPTPDAMEAFVHDTQPGAYERLVDTLLASPHHGEHAARSWLDLARYADSQGFEKDNLRTMWRYRDWVIDALNADMPFDQFTREQLAGDLLESPTLQQRIATGFHRNTQTNTEGGTDDEEFRCAAVIDRVNTTMQGWMGITAGCAQCHDHKYDPLRHQEYFELFALFNQTADADRGDDAPFIKAPTPDQVQQMAAIDLERKAMDNRLQASDPQMRAAIEDWLASRCGPQDWIVHHPLAAGAANGSLYTVERDGTVQAGGPHPATERTMVELRTDLPAVTALRLEVFTDGKALGRDGNTNIVLNDVKLKTSEAEGFVPFSNAQATFSQKDFDVAEAIDGDDSAGSGWALAPAFDRDHQAVFVLEDPLPVPDNGLVTVMLSQQWSHHGLNRFRVSLTDHPVAALTVSDELAHSNDLEQAALVDPDSRSDAQWRELATAALSTAPQLEDLRNEDAALKQRQSQLDAAIPTALVMESLPHAQQRTTKLFLGGSFLSPDDERGPLQGGTPAFLHPMQRDTSRAATRLDLANWLTASDNPLTARVQVNRIWEQLFGTGLVETVDDFGVQGARPSHPELLDWLALHWQNELNWSPKALLKLLVMSSVYRQSAHIEPVVLEQDPRNRLLSHAPRLRLSAEQLRDSALSCAGLLATHRIGGPSVMPRLPDGMLPQAFTDFVQSESTGDDLQRRGLYTQWRRTGHYPTFATFDAPSRELCQIARERSNTPLQALAMLNDGVFLEAAQGLARRSMVDCADPVGHAFELALARRPTGEERTHLRKIFHGVLAQDDIDHTLATEPIGPLPEELDPDTAVAMTVTCNVILNLDEFINRP
ncbi:MAG: DUF1549 domain-containing protein [Phycisphaerales bacterium]|nr:DUF1549 domain-containing protein [Phycisphaerales bacterium]